MMCGEGGAHDSAEASGLGRSKDEGSHVQDREGPPKASNLRKAAGLVEVLTVYCAALCEVQTYRTESVHEKFHELAGRRGLRTFPPGS